MSKESTSPRALRSRVSPATAPVARTSSAVKAGEERPILYADSEVGAALVAIGLSGLLRLLVLDRDRLQNQEAEFTAGRASASTDLCVHDRSLTGGENFLLTIAAPLSTG